MAHEEHIPEDMWLLRGLVAVFLLKCLKQTDFFDRLKISKEEEELLENSSNGNHSGLTSNEVFIGKVLFRLINVRNIFFSNFSLLFLLPNNSFNSVTFYYQNCSDLSLLNELF